MHPEIRRSGPGSCPVCGMALEPLVATASTGPSDELHDMTRRFWLGLLLAFPVLVLEMGSHLFPDLRNTVPPQYNTWLQLLLASPVVLWCGWPFFARAGMSLRNRSPEYVYPCCNGDRRSLGLQRHCNRLPLLVSCIVQKHGWPGGRLF